MTTRLFTSPCFLLATRFAVKSQGFLSREQFVNVISIWILYSTATMNKNIEINVCETEDNIIWFNNIPISQFHNVFLVIVLLSIWICLARFQTKLLPSQCPRSVDDTFHGPCLHVPTWIQCCIFTDSSTIYNGWLCWNWQKGWLQRHIDLMMQDPRSTNTRNSETCYRSFSSSYALRHYATMP